MASTLITRLLRHCDDVSEVLAGLLTATHAHLSNTTMSTFKLTCFHPLKQYKHSPLVTIAESATGSVTKLLGTESHALLIKV